MATNLNFEYGFDAQGIENLLAEVKGCVIKSAAGHARSEVSKIISRLSLPNLCTSCFDF